MFEWWKKLFGKQKLLPKDVENGLMTSMFYTIKIGEKLIVPENCVCFLSFKDKIYANFEAGEHILNEECLAGLSAKQAKSFKAKKTIKIDLFYVNLSKFGYSTSQREQIPVDEKLEKVELKSNFACKIVDANKFQNWALGYYALIRPIDCQHLVQNFVVETLNKYYLKRSLTKPIDNNAESESCKIYLNKKADKIGLTFTQFELSLHTKFDGTQKTKTKSFFASSQKTQQIKNINNENDAEKNAQTNIESIDNDEKKEYPLNVEDNESKKNEQQICPICKSKRIANAVFCHKCGYKF